MISLSEFKKQVKKVYTKRQYKIRNCFDIQRCFTYYRRHRPQESKFVITESQFYKILNAVHEEFIQQLLTGVDVILPMHMGCIRIVKSYPSVKYKDGELRNTYPIDWNKTIELWYEDEEAFRNKTLVRKIVNVKYCIIYSKKEAEYKNMYYFMIRFTRSLQKRVREFVQSHPEFDCALLY